MKKLKQKLNKIRDFISNTTFGSIILIIFIMAWFYGIIYITEVSDPKETQNTEEINMNDPEVVKLREAIKKLESEEPSRISENPTEEEIYNSEYIKHIRVALNGYLDGNISEADKPLSEIVDGGNKCGLDSFDKSYYTSKFIVVSARDSDYGGVQANLFFIEKPDTLFWVWIYKVVGEDQQDEYQMRAFCEDGPAPEEKTQFDEFTKGMIKNSKYSF